MGSWALVVGCDAYPKVDGGDLRGAVADALAVRTWLLDPGGGAVDPANLTLLASPSAAGAQLGDVVPAGPAGRSELSRAVRELVARTDVGEADRLYVYFAGHGCQTDPTNPMLSRDALALTGFDPEDPPGGTAGVDDLVRKLGQSAFGSVLVLVDACRDFPFATAFQLGGLGLDGPPGTRQYQPRTLLAQATALGGTAHGSEVGGVIRGDFTAALLAGLTGDGAAKEFDDTADVPYVVRWSSLRAYLEAALPGQLPRLRGDTDVVLATFPDGYFDPVTLTVEVDPTDARVAADLTVAVRYVDPAAYDDGRISHPGPTPVALSVPPRRHRVLATGGGYQGKRSVDVYGDLTVTLPLTATPKPPTKPPNWPNDGGGTSILPPDHGGLDGGPTQPQRPPDYDGPLDGGPLDIDFEPGDGGYGLGYAEDLVLVDGPRRRVTRGGRQDSDVVIGSNDPGAAIEVRDTSGRAVAGGVGRLTATLPPGAYTAAVVDRAGREVTEPCDLDPGEHFELWMPVTPREDPDAALVRTRPDRHGEWLGPAATAALAVARELPTPTPLLVVLGAAGLPPAEVVTPGVVRIDAVDETLVDPERGWALVLLGRPVGGAVTLDLGITRLTVPTLASPAVTAVVLGRAITVGLYDWPLLTGDAEKALLLDRAQALLAAGRPTVAERLLGDLARYSAVARALGRRGEPDAALATAVPPAERHRLLDAGPWAVLLDADP
jgi:hypothetical protein